LCTRQRDIGKSINSSSHRKPLAVVVVTPGQPNEASLINISEDPFFCLTQNEAIPQLRDRPHHWGKNPQFFPLFEERPFKNNR
jgi:hypothetical protein